MKTQSLFRASLLILFPLLVFGHGNGQKIKHRKEKTIKREFRVNPNATLKVDNSYGNLNIVTWSENRIVMEVHITTSGSDESKVQEKLDDIAVIFHASPNMVSAETIFDANNDNSWWDHIFGSGSVNMQIDYRIKMPITNHVDLDNDYGNISLDKLQGRAVISCDYGKITTGELMGDNNSLSFDYSDNCYFEYIKNGSIEADYSGFTVGKTKQLDISADYTQSEVKIAESVTFNCDYGSIEIGKTNNVKGSSDYLTMRFGDIYENIRIEADYGSIKVERMMENAADLHINSNYTDIEIGLQPGYDFTFAIDLVYSSLDTPDGFNFSKKIIDSADEYYEGFYGSSNTRNTVRIESEYGGVEFYVH